MRYVCLVSRKQHKGKTRPQAYHCIVCSVTTPEHKVKNRRSVNIAYNISAQGFLVEHLLP